MLVIEGLCLPVFCVFCVMMVRSVCMSVSCCFSCELCCCVGVWMWVVGFAPCVRVTGRVLHLFGGVWVWVKEGLVTFEVTVVGVVLGIYIVFHPRM